MTQAKFIKEFPALQIPANHKLWYYYVPSSVFTAKLDAVHVRVT